ncbi:hypothetical protein HAX54_004504, partial [Datura stramonium]|nr:hypothetical protein [Datura stramonium]
MESNVSHETIDDTDSDVALTSPVSFVLLDVYGVVKYNHFRNKNIEVNVRNWVIDSGAARHIH